MCASTLYKVVQELFLKLKNAWLLLIEDAHVKHLVTTALMSTKEFRKRLSPITKAQNTSVLIEMAFELLQMGHEYMLPRLIGSLPVSRLIAQKWSRTIWFILTIP